MALLSDRTIRELCDAPQPLIQPFEERRLKPASYDLTVGKEYYLYHDNHERHVDRAIVTDFLRPNCSMTIYPNGVCFVLTEERVNLPDNVSGSLSLPLALIKRGVLLARQPPLDPGYEGHLVAMLYNLSSENVYLHRGDHVLSVEFTRLDKAAEQAYDQEPDGQYMNLRSLRDVLDRPLISSLEHMRRSLSSMEAQIGDWRNSMFNWISAILVIVTIVIALLALTPILYKKDASNETQKAREGSMAGMEKQLREMSQRLEVLEGAIGLDGGASEVDPAIKNNTSEEPERSVSPSGAGTSQ